MTFCIEVPVPGRPSEHHPLGRHVKGQELMRTQVPKGAMRSGMVVGLAVALAPDLRLRDRGEELAVQEFVAKARVKQLTLPILPGDPGSMKYRVTPISLAQRSRAWEVNSGPLSTLR